MNEDFKLVSNLVRYMKMLYKLAKVDPKKILFFEFEDVRVLEAMIISIKKKIALPVVYCDEKVLKKVLKNNNYLKYFKKIQIISPTSVKFSEINNSKKQLNFVPALLLKHDYVDGVIIGATHSTADSVRPALKFLDMTKRISGANILIVKKKTYIFADCAINIKPDAKILADIILGCVDTAKYIGLVPKIALVTYTTKGSATNDFIKVIKKAITLVKKVNKNLLIDGDLQVDAAIVPEVSRLKEKNSILKGTANVLIFPDLNSGNIAYKLIQRFCGAQVVGPILQGFVKPYNDLSRGCTVEEIVNLAAFSTIQAQSLQ